MRRRPETGTRGGAGARRDDHLSIMRLHTIPAVATAMLLLAAASDEVVHDRWLARPDYRVHADPDAGVWYEAPGRELDAWAVPTRRRDGWKTAT